VEPEKFTIGPENPRRDFNGLGAYAYNEWRVRGTSKAGIAHTSLEGVARAGDVGSARMRRILRLFFREAPVATSAWSLSEQQRREVLELLSEIGLGIVAEGRGPVPLMKFGQRVLERLETNPPRKQPIPLPHFADALKRVILDMGHDRLRVMSPTDFLGVGYVYNAEDPETWPYRGSVR